MTVVSASLLILARLRARRVEPYDALLKYVKKGVPGGSILFLPALNLLFLLGLVEYQPKTDAIEYVGST
jgi:hypothetical protein